MWYILFQDCQEMLFDHVVSQTAQLLILHKSQSQAHCEHPYRGPQYVYAVYCFSSPLFFVHGRTINTQTFFMAAGFYTANSF